VVLCERVPNNVLKGTRREASSCFAGIPAARPLARALCCIRKGKQLVAFDDLERARIERLVGAFCRRRSPPQFKDQLRVVYEIEGHSVSVYEERPLWNGKGEWTRLGVARFRYFRSREEWTLYWMRRDLKWHLYDPETPARNLAALVKVVDEDEYGVFFG
jgi:hypothetical protein